MDCLFCKIIEKKIPAKIEFEDPDFLAFHDINPQAPIHVLIIPKRPILRIAETSKEDALLLGKLLLTATEVARRLGLEQKGYRLVINNGPDGGEAVPHLHIHLLGGRSMNWPPG